MTGRKQVEEGIKEIGLEKKHAVDTPPSVEAHHCS